ncbi:MAG: DUF1679 domain-containing protein [Crocinitomicaceae bacterium]|nr:DUF1679 domain-containing protein [Crocinitomicaceae bacterium]
MLNIDEIVISQTNSTEIQSKEVIQELWSGYGAIIRYTLNGGDYNSIVVKHINLENNSDHPRGWNTTASHERKVESYRVETEFYTNHGKVLAARIHLPHLINSIVAKHETVLILQDVAEIGFTQIHKKVTLNQLKLCISWIAILHINTLNKPNTKLWKKGSYWNLSTRTDEFNKMSNSTLKGYAKRIDQKLEETNFKCLIHGDAKLANFCFHHTKNEVLGLDFQYTGHGCGIKDLVYLIGSALSSEDCFKYEKELIDFYFNELRRNLNNNIDFNALEQEWRPLFSIAWADFNRFLLGWMPDHPKLNAYSESITERAIQQLRNIKDEY